MTLAESASAEATRAGAAAMTSTAAPTMRGVAPDLVRAAQVSADRFDFWSMLALHSRQNV
jgi:hypothetical protein